MTDAVNEFVCSISSGIEELHIEKSKEELIRRIIASGNLHRCWNTKESKNDNS